MLIRLSALHPSALPIRTALSAVRVRLPLTISLTRTREIPAHIRQVVLGDVEAIHTLADPLARKRRWRGSFYDFVSKLLRVAS
jgi:hypothetical protein